jgi:CRISPR/Cas system-associated exonuclease Cas4 (RecB family)
MDEHELPDEQASQVGEADFHLGYSRVSCYSNCPRQYQYAYIERLSYTAGVPLRKGTAYHAALEKMLQYKIKHGMLASEEDCRKYARKVAVAEKLTEREVDNVVEAVVYYYHTHYEMHQPAFVEADFAIIRGGVKLTGRIDVIDHFGQVIDHKFSSDIWAEERAQYGCQPIIYQWAYEDLYEEKLNAPYSGFVYNIIRLFPSPMIQELFIPPCTQEESDWWEEQISGIARGIEAGSFPGKPSKFNCGFCSHKKVCKPVIYTTHAAISTDGGDPPIDFSVS